MNKELTDAIADAESQLRIIVDAMTVKGISGEIEHRIIAAYVLIATNHFESIIELVRIGKHISASALVRPNFEAFIRATWLAVKEDDKRVKKAIRYLARNKDEFPPLGEMRREVKEVFDIEFCDAKTYKAFNNYTHGGSHLISRCMDENTISPQFREDELIGMLKGVSLNTILCALAFAEKSDNEVLAKTMNKMILECLL